MGMGVENLDIDNAICVWIASPKILPVARNAVNDVHSRQSLNCQPNTTYVLSNVLLTTADSKCMLLKAQILKESLMHCSGLVRVAA